MKAKETMKKVMMIAALAGATALPALAETLCSGESAEVKLDLATGTMRTPAATETLTYSTEWDGGDAVTLAVNGETLASGLTGSGTYDWTPSGSGLFTLTHTTSTSSGNVVLTAAFMIPPNYVAPVYVDNIASNGIAYWTTNAVPSGYTVVGSAASRVTWGKAGATSWYVADGDVQIDGGVQCKGYVNLVLCDGAKLTVTNVADSCAGIATDASGSFTIYGTPEGAGELSATAGRWYGAGIGGGDMEDGSHITINGGTVTATGGSCGAGIGGGEFASGTDIVINGGIVYAKCIRVDGGAGIGGGYWGAGKDIVINGGVVYAEGGFGNAAIGGGSEEKGSDIAINGGKVSVFTVISMNYVGTEKEKAEVGDFIGSGNLADAAENVSIADSASVCFNLSGVYRGSPPPYEWIEEPAPSPKDFEGFVIMTPSTQRVDLVLVGGVKNWTAAKTFALTNAVTGATDEIAVNGDNVAFANKLLSLPHIDNKLMLTAERYSMINPPTEVANTTATVYTNAVEDATLVETPIVVRKDAIAYVVYTAADGYVFADGTTAKTNTIDTSVHPATAEAPDAPFFPVAKNVETETKYLSVQAAFDEATDGQTIALMTDVTENVMITTGQANTLDLAGHVLKGDGSGTAPVVTINSAAAAITIRDTSTGHTGAITTGGVVYSGNGAGINIAAGSLSLYGVTITNCVSSGNGGAIYGGINTQILAKDCLINGNSASGSGGGIYMVGGTGPEGDPPPETTDKLVLISTLITENEAGTAGAGVYFKKTAKGELSCFVAGTRVAMADGTTKAIEEIKEGDVVKTFDHEGGTNSSARVFIWLKEAITTRAFTLAFAGGYSVTCVLTHDFLMKDGENSCKYVCLGRSNAADYVGKLFYGMDGQWHELQSVTDGEEVSEIYELYTAQHFNSYANGLLTVPVDVAANLNFYKLDANLKADATELAADVAKYGYYTYEEAAARGVSRDYYDDAGMKYVNVIVGKGLATWEELEKNFALAQEWADTGAAPKLTMAAVPKLAAANAEPKLDDFYVGVLTLGEDVVVTNNTASGAKGNIYLVAANSVNNVNSFIRFTESHAGICAGVACEWGAGQFTTANNVTASDVQYFTSDNDDYAVRCNAEALELFAVSSIVPMPLANTTYTIYTNGAPVDASSIIVERGTSAYVTYTVTAEGYVFTNGLTTITYTCDTSVNPAAVESPSALVTEIKDTLVVETETTEKPPVEKPAVVKDETWKAATNAVSTVIVVNGMGLVSEETITNCVDAARDMFSGQDVTEVSTEVKVTVKPVAARASVEDVKQIAALTVDVAPVLITTATVNGEEREVSTKDITEGAEPILISIDVSGFARTPILIKHEHGGVTTTYTRGPDPTLSTFAYDADSKTVQLLMQQFSNVIIYGLIQVGDNAWADIYDDGRCVISGMGDMWDKSGWPDGANPLAAYKKSITSVTVESGVTSVGQAAFYKFYAVTNVTVAASVTHVADHAFYNCHSLQSIAFQGETPTFGDQAIKYTAAIRMNGSVPEVYTIPNVTSSTRKVWAKDKLTDKDWTDVTDKTDAERGAYHFFKVEM